MTRPTREDLALRREALAARAALQRIELAATADRARQRSLASKGVGALALRLARSLATAPAVASSASRARPLALSAGWLLVRALRASPTMRWVAGAAAVGGAVWWMARTMRAEQAASAVDDAADDGAGDSGDRNAGERGGETETG